MAPGGREEITSLQKFLRSVHEAELVASAAGCDCYHKVWIKRVGYQQMRTCARQQDGNKQQHDDEYVIAKARGKGSDKRPCWFHSTPEGCSRGRDCPFSHDGPSGQQDLKDSKGKGKRKKGKDHDQSADTVAKAKAEAKAKAKAAAKEAKRQDQSRSQGSYRRQG